MSDSNASPAEASPARYCRKCGYDLRESSDRCPECGRSFDAGNPKTYRRKPASAVGRWVKRGLFVLAVPACAYLGLTGWLWWGWRGEQKAMISLGRYTIASPVETYPWAKKVLPRRLYFLGDRAKALSSVGMGGLLTIKGDSQAAELDHFKFLKNISLEGITDAGMSHLNGLTRLQYLAIYSSPTVTDRAMGNLGAMTQIEELAIRQTSVDDAGLVYLRNMTKLKYLSFVKSRITGSGFAHLSGLHNLKILAIEESPITDLALRDIASIQSLQELDLYYAPVSDAGIEHLAGLAQLQALGLQGSQVKGPGLIHLSKLTGLDRIDLSETPLTDAAVDPLIDVARAQKVDDRSPMTLNLEETQLTAEGVQRLRDALPKARIRSNYGN